MLAVLLALMGGVFGLSAIAGGSDNSNDSGAPAPDKITAKPDPSHGGPVVAKPEPDLVPVDDTPTQGSNKPGKDHPVKEPPATDSTVTPPTTDSGSGQTDTPPVYDTIGTPQAPSGQVKAPDQVSHDPVTLDTSLSATAVSGRVMTLKLPDSTIQSLKVLHDVSYGHVSINPDNTIAVVLTGTTETTDQTFSVEATHADGTVTQYEVSLDVTEGRHEGGWGEGNFYMLETDENDDVVVEHGENHRVIYISGDPDALTLDDIAALEDRDSLSSWWLKNASQDYGGSPDMALSPEAGMAIWYATTDGSNEPSSNWLLFERGYDYTNVGRLVPWGAEGESELHPLYIGAYGEGDTPVIDSQVRAYQTASKNVVIQGLHFTDGIQIFLGENILLDDLTVTGGEMNIQSTDGFTLRNSDVYDVIKEDPQSPTATYWDANASRTTGLYVNAESVLIEGNLFDHIGWEDDYMANLSTEGGQPPSKYSHNVYVQYGSTDVTFRDNITMQGASFGAQIRSGGFIEDNVFIDNNAQVNFSGGKVEDEYRTGNYTLFTDNLVTSSSYKHAEQIGATSLGVHDLAYMSSLVDNIVAHMADPNNPEEIADKPYADYAVNHTRADYYDDTIIYNWSGVMGSRSEDANVEGLNTDILDQTTIQNFASQLLGKENATISDLADYLRLQGAGAFDNVVDADLIINFFQTGFGLETTLRADAETLRFVPNDLGDGVRWDNRLNWSTEDLPGTQDGDSVNLGGNHVIYSGTTRIENLTFGAHGALDVSQGRLDVEGGMSVADSGAELDIDRAGQFWTNGYTDHDRLTINADGGRFANTGLFTGTTDLTVSDNAQAILGGNGADFVLNGDSSLTLVGDDIRVGFDGQNGGTGVLLMADNADLNFVAEDGKLGEISEFFSGKYASDTRDIKSGVNLGDADLHIDLSGIAGGGATSQTLIRVDEIIGRFGSLELTGIGSNQDANVTVDYDSDTVVLTLGEAGKGSGVRNLYTTGNEASAQSDADLWAALTNGHGIYPDDPPEDIPADEGELIEI